MKTILIILVSILIAQCGSEKNNDSSSSQAAVKVGTNIASPKPSDALTGIWKSPCSGDSIVVDTYTYSDKSQNRVISTYSDTNCTQLVAKGESKRTYVINGSNIDFTVVKMTYTMVDQETVDGCNQIACFGFTDWAINVGKEITGLAADSSSEPNPKAGDKFYQIFKVNGSVLSFGDTSVKGYEGDSAEARPTTYADLVLIKQ